MLPGVGFSLLFGNLWYAWMARKLAGYDNRTNVTAHPYGVNTPAGLLMTFNVVFKLVEIYMLDEYFKDVQAGRSPLGANEVADNIWKGATAACFFVGLVETAERALNRNANFVYDRDVYEDKLAATNRLMATLQADFAAGMACTPAVAWRNIVPQLFARDLPGAASRALR